MTTHLYRGDCPDETQPDARDPECKACAEMAAPTPEPQAADHVVDANKMVAQPAAQAVAADKWEGAEEWMPLAWELCAEECGEDACTELVWEGGPIPEPWGDRWLKYEGEAKRLIALVRKCTAAAAPVALTTGDRTRALNLAYQFRSHPASRSIDEIEQAGEIILALLSAAPVAQPLTPLTDERIVALFVDLNAQAAQAETPTEMFSIIVRAVERAHGISTSKGGA